MSAWVGYSELDRVRNSLRPANFQLARQQSIDRPETAIGKPLATRQELLYQSPASLSRFYGVLTFAGK